MNVPAPADLLRAWESGVNLPAPARAAAVLASLEARELAELARLPVGRRDAALFGWRERLFGPRLDAVTECPNCGERAELSFNVREVEVTPPSLPAAGNGSPLVCETEAGSVEFRLPNSLDLVAAAAAGDAAGAQAVLVRRCLLGARDAGGQALPIEQLPPGTIRAVGERMVELDPQADVQLDLACPTCAHRWISLFDIGEFLWAELDATARRIVGEVHELAAAYGWSETEVLALPTARRQAYLDLVRA